MNIIRAWKDPIYRATLEASEQGALDSPAGMIELTGTDLDQVAGGHSGKCGGGSGKGSGGGSGKGSGSGGGGSAKGSGKCGGSGKSGGSGKCWSH